MDNVLNGHLASGNINYCFYWPDGEIAMYGSCPVTDLSFQAMEGYKVKNLGKDFKMPEVLHHINDAGDYTQCETYTVDTIPVPCEIHIEGVKYNIGESDPTPTFEFDAPGTYTIHVNAGAKYTREEFNVDQA